MDALLDPADMEELRQLRIIEYQLGGEDPEPALDAVTQLSAELFGVPSSAVTVLRRDRQLFQGACGLSARSSKRSDAFCNFTVERDDVFVVEDAQADPRFRDNVLVTDEPRIRFYAGAPLKIGGGVAIGSLCVLDRKPRQFTDSDRRRLILLAQTVTNLIEFRLGSRLAEERQRQIEHQAELLRATVDHVEQGIVLFDQDFRMILWNNRLVDLLGIDRSFCREGCDAADLFQAAARNGAFSEDDPDQVVAGLIASLRQPSSKHFELQGVNGRTLQSWHAVLADGRSLLTVEDVTEQRRAVQMKDEFVSTVSHELRTPLTSIRGALAVLGRKAAGLLDGPSEQMLAMASKNAERLTTLINDILDIEKLGSGTLAMRREAVDVGEVLRDACEHNRPFAEAHGVSLTLELDSEPLRVIGDHGRLLQAVTNLISNACKFSPAGSTIAISGRVAEARAQIDVQDQGPGIPEEFRPLIFRRFAQADPAHKSGAVGTGLGLAITKAIVQAHLGEIGFTTASEQGTRFWIRLPMTAGSFNERA